MASSKRSFPFKSEMENSSPAKKIKNKSMNEKFDMKDEIENSNKKKSHAPLAERMRPNELEDYIGQHHLIGPKTLLHDLLKNNEIPSMILWGPPGCGKTSLVNIIMHKCKYSCDRPTKFIKLSASTASINDVRKAVTEAKTQAKLGGRTIVFMDEIHRFNKLQQDIFLPHVEAGTFILIGATTENPSSALNSALLSRCRVFILEKLHMNELITILHKAIISMNGRIIKKNDKIQKSSKATFSIDQHLVDWLADVCDGDARVALGALEMSVQATVSDTSNKKQITLNLDDIKSNLMKTQTLTNKISDTLYQLHSALHHSIKASEDNAALYWLARIMETGEDPVFTARKLVKIASEEISLEDEEAQSTAVHTMYACQMVGMPECDVMLGQCVIYLARAEKSKEIINALRRSQETVENHKGPQPKVPLFIKDRSGQGKIRATIGKNLVRQENMKKCFLPDGLEGFKFFKDEDC